MADAGHRSKELLRGAVSYVILALAIFVGILLAFLTPQKNGKYPLGISIGTEAQADVVTSGVLDQPDDGDGGSTCGGT